MSLVVLERTVVCRTPLGPLWNLVSDTTYLNRLAGNAPISTDPVRDHGAVRYRVRTRAVGFNVEWEEQPFEWVHQQRYRVKRRLLAGPAEFAEFAVELEPRGGEVDVRLRLSVMPKLRLLTPLVRMSASRMLANLAGAVGRMDALGQRAQSTPPLGDAIARARSVLARSVAPELAARLCSFLTDERDERVARIRPFALADEWGIDRSTLLGACLRAVPAGLLEMRWELICPSCQTGSESVSTLSSLADHGSCHLCEIQFGLDTDEAVEVTFRPAPAIRTVDVAQYCVGGPSRTPHVWAQAVLPAGGVAEMVAPTLPGRYRLFVRGGSTAPLEIVADAPAELAVDDTHGDKLVLAPTGTLRVRNTHADERHLKIERVESDGQAATARTVTAMPGFRREFSSEILRSDRSLRVSRVAIFFSDLAASTQLYATMGDAAAFKLVQDHFEVVIGCIERHGGTVVKTIGDAVMAAFSDELRGLDASLACLEAFAGFRRTHPLGAHTDIKLGLFAGQSYLVTLNSVLDYFGQTVNIAARLQSQAEGGELVIDAELADAAVASGRLPSSAIRERFTATLKGVAQPISLARIGRGSP